MSFSLGIGRPSRSKKLPNRGSHRTDTLLRQTDANKQRSIPSDEWDPAGLPPDALQAVKDYLSTLDDAAFGAASEVVPKFISPSDPAAQWTGAHRGPAFFAYATNDLIDTDNAIIVDVEASRAIRQLFLPSAGDLIRSCEGTVVPVGMSRNQTVAKCAIASATEADWSMVGQCDAPSHCCRCRGLASSHSIEDLEQFTGLYR